MTKPSDSPGTNSLSGRYYVLLALVLLCLIGIFVSPIAIDVHREVRRSAIHSYVASVLSTVNEFHDQHGRYPQSLNEIDTSALDYDVGIPLEELDYRVTDIGVSVSYTMSDGHIVSYSTRFDRHASEATLP
jgi:hypothetical protein